MAGALDTAFKSLAKSVVADLGSALDTTITYSVKTEGSYNVAAGKQLEVTTTYADIKVPIEFIKSGVIYNFANLNSLLSICSVCINSIGTLIFV